MFLAKKLDTKLEIELTANMRDPIASVILNSFKISGKSGPRILSLMPNTKRLA
jgi:hypothetical protein